KKNEKYSDLLLYENNFAVFACVIMFILLIFMTAALITLKHKFKRERQERTEILERQKEVLQKEIDEKHKVMETLSEKKEHLRLLLENIPYLVWLKNKKGEYLNCSLKFIQLYNAGYSDIIGKTDYDFIDREAAGNIRKADLAIMESGCPMRSEEDVTYLNDGHKELLEIIKTPVYGFNKKLVGILGIARDITIRKKAEKELIIKNHHLESILSNIQGITYRCLFNHEWEMLYISSHVETLTGYPPEDFINNSKRSFISVIHPEDRAFVYNNVSQAVKNRMPWEIEYRLLNRKRVLWVYEKGEAQHDLYGNVMHLQGFIINITEKKIMEARFMQADKMASIGMLAGGIAHDFNNILSGIMGFSELIKADLKKIQADEKMYKRLDHIRKGGVRASELVSQILSFSRSENGGLRPVKTSLIAKETAKLLRASLSPGISIEEHYSADPYVLGDPTKIHQILMNLCTNAAYAMKDNGGKLKIDIRSVFHHEVPMPNAENNPGETYTCICVEDNGCGMDDKLIEKAMEPFFTTKPKGSGTGMGLWLIRGIVEKMQGRIDISSQVGKGSIFKVYLPEYKEKINVKDTDLNRVPPGGKEHLLVVDDEESLVQLSAVSLSQLGYKVSAFRHAKEAVTIYEKNPREFDLVITDMEMPEIKGNTLAKMIRKINPAARIILYSGEPYHNSTEENLRLFDSVLKKPVAMYDFAQTIRDVIQHNNL
ncbi:MAG: PAS domain S-box protein, partial [Desulfobacterales bacterium]|nr:PAS domain S-box protein [Desulfobacterales bacterium]